MDRAEKWGLGVALLGHVVLFGLLSAGFLSRRPPEPPKAKPIDISLVDAVALQSAAPPVPEPAAQSRAPEPAPPEDAAPPAPAPEPKPEPVPPAPKAKPEPLPKPKSEPAPAPKPAPKAKPEPAPAPKPLPKAPPLKKPSEEKQAKPDRTRTLAARDASPVGASAAARPAVTAARGTGSTPLGRKPRAGGSILDPDFRKGLTLSPSPSKATTPPPGATMNAQAAADIGSAIRRQVQPCANRQIIPGPGASRIKVIVRLSMNRDGSLAAPPVIGDAQGVDDENSRYVDAVKRAALATFTGCSPLRDLPPGLYDVPRGWKTFTLRYNLPD